MYCPERPRSRAEVSSHRCAGQEQDGGVISSLCRSGYPPWCHRLAMPVRVPTVVSSPRYVRYIPEQWCHRLVMCGIEQEHGCHRLVMSRSRRSTPRGDDTYGQSREETPRGDETSSRVIEGTTRRGDLFPGTLVGDVQHPATRTVWYIQHPATRTVWYIPAPRPLRVVYPCS